MRRRNQLILTLLKVSIASFLFMKSLDSIRSKKKKKKKWNHIKLVVVREAWEWLVVSKVQRKWFWCGKRRIQPKCHVTYVQHDRSCESSPGLDCCWQWLTFRQLVRQSTSPEQAIFRLLVRLQLLWSADFDSTFVKSKRHASQSKWKWLTRNAIQKYLINKYYHSTD